MSCAFTAHWHLLTDDRLTGPAPRFPPASMSTSRKQKAKSYFAHYESGSGSDSESDADDQDMDDQMQGDDEAAGAAGEAGSRNCDGLSEDEEPSVKWTSAKEFHQSLMGKTADQVRIPARYKGPVDPALVEQLQKLKHRKETKDEDIKYEIQKRKDFRNPSIYEKLIDHLTIKECGTNFPADVFDPDDFSPESYYDRLSIAQKNLMEQTEKEPHPKVEIVHAVAKKSTTTTSSSSSSSDPSRKKRSKWDEGPPAKR